MTTKNIDIITQWKVNTTTHGASPLDIPLRCRRTIEKDILTLEFTYSTKESLKKKKRGKSIRIFRGKNSGRIHKIQFLKLSLLEDEMWHEFVVDSILSSISSYNYVRAWHEYIVKQATKEMLKQLKNQEHYPFCNYWNSPARDCKLCKQLRENYPENGKTAKELIQDYFPEVQVREMPNYRA